jgi:peptidoglycan/LPS O-acetylase OafA/YrhL
MLRRALRIFPLYFLVVAALFFLDTTGDQSRFLYYGTFTSNFYIHQAEYWPLPGSIWSISVQEQFYLFWPWVILFVPNRYLLHAFLLFTVTGIVSHYYLDTTEFGNILTIACLDSLGIGALLAWSVQRFPDRLSRVQYGFRIAALVIAGLYIAGIFLAIPVVPQRTLVSILAAVIVCGLVCRNAQKKSPSRVLSNRFLLFVGKISFGLYLFHQVIPFFTFPVIDRFLQANLSSSLQSYKFLFLSLITVAMVVSAAWLSWKFIESPFLSLKKYVVPKPVQQEAPVVAVAPVPAMSDEG